MSPGMSPPFGFFHRITSIFLQPSSGLARIRRHPRPEPGETLRSFSRFCSVLRDSRIAKGRRLRDKAKLLKVDSPTPRAPTCVAWPLPWMYASASRNYHIHCFGAHTLFYMTTDSKEGVDPS